MSSTLRMKQHDTAKPLTITCTDGGQAVDLTTATSVKVIGARNDSASTLFSRTVTGTDEGVVVMAWQPADTALPGLIKVEVEVHWPDSTVQTFPGSGHLSVLVERDLG